MGFYNTVILPRLLQFSMRSEMLAPYRRHVGAEARGRVLEIGVGSGANLAYYGPETIEVIGLEPSRPLLAMARRAAAKAPRPVSLLEASAESIPLDAASIDTVVVTMTLCSIPDVARALSEMRRVLKPGGRLLFVEHGRAPDARVRAWQDRLTPFWRAVAGGCHLNRPMCVLIEEAGFRVEALQESYLPGPRPLTYFYDGSASR